MDFGCNYRSRAMRQMRRCKVISRTLIGRCGPTPDRSCHNTPQSLPNSACEVHHDFLSFARSSRVRPSAAVSCCLADTLLLLVWRCAACFWGERCDHQQLRNASYGTLPQRKARNTQISLGSILLHRLHSIVPTRRDIVQRFTDSHRLQSPVSHTTPITNVIITSRALQRLERGLFTCSENFFRLPTPRSSRHAKTRTPRHLRRV